VTDASDPIGPANLSAIFDEHVADEFEAKDVDATMRTMVAEPYVTHVPTLAGGVGAEEVRRFYDTHFIGTWPDDVSITEISRTVGESRVVAELVMNFTHDRVIDALLPGIAPTHRPVRLPVVVVMGFEGGKVAYEHIYWDQATLLVQVGALDGSTLPVSGSEQAAKLLDKHRPSNGLIERFG
jgi:carboxymethylenebutenolidase